MVGLDASTPQTKAIKRLGDAYCSLDLNNVEPLLSTQNYQYEPVPECTDFPKQTKESHLQMWGVVFSSMKKCEVCISHQRTAFELRLTSTTPRSFITK